MGSQQLLLVVLGVIVVGIAVVIGIAVFGSNAADANKDAISQDMLRLATAAQAYYSKPRLLGGGDKSFVGLTLPTLGLPTARNENGTFAIRRAMGTRIVIIGTSASVPNAVVRAVIYQDRVSLRFSGWKGVDDPPHPDES